MKKKYLETHNIKEGLRYCTELNMHVRKASTITGIPRTTMKRYLEHVLQGGFSWGEINQMDDAELKAVLQPKRGKSKKKREPDYEYVREQLRMRHVTRYMLWEEYALEDKETALSYSQFASGFRKYVGTLDRSMRKLHLGGRAEVDWAGRTMKICDQKTGEEYKVSIFVGVLTASNLTYANACRSQKLEDWIEAHNGMFQFFGGVPLEIVPDNTKTAVIKPGTDPVLNRTYKEHAHHNNYIILPTRPGKPKDKGKVEGAVLIVSRWILARLRHRKFFSLVELNEAIQILLKELNNKPFKKLPGCRTSQFELVDKPLLHQLCKPYVFAEWIGKQKVAPDYHIHVKGHYYSVPHTLVGSEVEVKIVNKEIQVSHLGKCVTTHAMNDDVGGHTTKSEHQLDSHRAYNRMSKASMLSWAEQFGFATIKFVEHQFQEKKHIALALRACSSLQNTAKEYEKERVEAACEHADMIGSLTLTSVRSILRRKIDQTRLNSAPVQGHLPFHSNVRGADYYSGGQV